MSPDSSKRTGNDVRLLRKSYMKITGSFDTRSPGKNAPIREVEEEYREGEDNSPEDINDRVPPPEELMRSASDASKLRSQIDMLNMTVRHMKEEIKVNKTLSYHQIE